ncbi:myosin light chain kinase family member 4 isoform X2 [Mixophyes fleayi]|uniref:myosin light chain kinase family member 4 isoform X2 n=1 Tax=Mixophyes fleayi TaxID=3061075 RepID=UPI003F4E2F84
MGGKQKEHLKYPEQNIRDTESQEGALILNKRMEGHQNPDENGDINNHICMSLKLLRMDKMESCCNAKNSEEMSCSHFQKAQIMTCVWDEKSNESEEDTDNEEFINDQITSEKKINVSLSLKGTKSIKKKKPPDTERSVQKTLFRKYKEKVQKLNRENTEKASVILVDNKSAEIKYEENFVSIDIPNSHIKPHVQDGIPIIFSVEENEKPTSINEECVQALPEVSDDVEDTGENLANSQEDKGEEKLIILVTEDIPDIPDIQSQNKYEDNEGKHDALDEQEEGDSIHNITNSDKIKAVQDSTESTASEDPITGTDTSDHLSPSPTYHDTEFETTDTPLTESGEDEEDVQAFTEEEDEDDIDEEEEEEEEEVECLEECSQNGEFCHNEQGCNSKRRVTDQDHMKEDSKKSRLDTKDTEESTTYQDSEGTTIDFINNKEAQASKCVDENKEQSSLQEELLILDATPPPPAPFDHRIVSAKSAQINNYYTVEKAQVLGGGRFGQVHRCVENASGLTLAAKIIKVRGLKEKEEAKNEIYVMNQLNHSNLIQLYDAFESRNDIILVMEYVDGGELFDRIIDENCNLSEVDTILFIKQICEGIQFMHQMYIIHLDLKPENIMCVSRADYQIKIIDFGLARRYKPREKLKVHFGTPEFLAPEVVNYDFVSFPTDMWSVGVIAYMLLSGLSPFLGENDNETLNNILVSEFDFEGEEFLNISESAKDFISKLLIKEKCWRMSASEALKHPWLSDSKLHFRISKHVSTMRKIQSCSLSEAPVDQ